MTTSVNSLQTLHYKLQQQDSVQPPKTLQSQAEIQNAGAQDTVTISQEARQALASNTKLPSGADVNPAGNNH